MPLLVTPLPGTGSGVEPIRDRAEAPQEIEVHSETTQTRLYRPDVNTTRRYAGTRGQGRGHTRADAGRHCRALISRVNVRVMIHGDAAPGDQKAVDALREKRPVRDLVDVESRDQLASFAVLGPALLAVRRMPALLARVLLISIHRDDIIVAPPGEDVVLSHQVLASNATRLTHTYRPGRVKDKGTLEAGDVLPCEPCEL